MDEEAFSSLELWDEVDMAESFLVSSLYEEAISRSIMVLKKARGNSFVVYPELQDVLESVGMILVQSLQGLGRTAHIMDEIVNHFPSVIEIPTRVLITGACIQISNDMHSGVSNVLEKFLNKWICIDESVCALQDNNGDDSSCKKTLNFRDYVDVVEVYTHLLLGMTLKKWDVAICWVQKSTLPQALKQELLRRLTSCSVEVATTSQKSSAEFVYHKGSVPLSNGAQLIDGSPVLLTAKCQPEKTQSMMPPLWCLRWFRSVKLRAGGVQLEIASSKVALWCVLILMCFIVRRKRAALNSFVRRQTASVKKALADAWQLAFSYQVNPLAAVESLPAPPRSGP